MRITTGADYDLDASALLCDENGKVASNAHFVFYNNCKGPDGSVEHTGDNLTGEGDGDDEVITVNLATVPTDVAKSSSRSPSTTPSPARRTSVRCATPTSGW